MALQTKSKIRDAKEVAEEAQAKKNQAKAFMAWEVVNPDGTPILDDEGKPQLKSDKDIPFWQNPNFKSAAEDTLIALAQQYAENSDGDGLELTLKVKIKPYTPKPKKPLEELAALLGISKAA